MRRVAISFSRTAAVLLLAGLGLPASGQGPSQTKYSNAQLQTYDSFLFRVTWLEAQADKLASQGKSPSFARSLIRTQAGLTAQEEAAVKAIAADCKTQGAGITSAAKVLMAAGARASASQPLMNLRNQRDQTVANHIDQLRAALGAARFPVLDAFVHTASTTGGTPIQRPITPLSKSGPGR